MKRLTYLILCLILANASSVYAEQQAAGGQLVIQKEEKGVFKGLLYKMWDKLRSFDPKPPSKKSDVVATAGIRGAETTESLIKPYWKDDRSKDPDYIKELTEYARAQQLAEDGSLEGAVAAFNQFIEQHNDSDLKPNAQFALAISYGALGNNESSKGAFKAFIDDNPKHPLIADARQMMGELK